LDSPLLHPGTFTWAVGIEDTFIGRRLPGGGRTLDEYALTQHYRRWRGDLDRAASLGIKAIRYGLPWYRVNPRRGRFDWSWADPVLEYAAGHHRLLVIADLVHYGTPLWIRDSFADPDYPEAVAEYAAAFASRYAGLINHYTPLNEPTVTASFCGGRGVWPPHLTGWRGWTRVVQGVVEGMRTTISALRHANPRSVIVLVEASKPVRTDDPSLGAEVELERERGFLPTDLLLGRVGSSHPLYGWFLEHGADPAWLSAVQENPPMVEMLGVNYYPDLSPRELVRHNGSVVQVAYDGWDEGLADALTSFWERYRLPMLLAETSTGGGDQRRGAWLTASTERISSLRGAGVSVAGYTWWPLFDMVDWSFSTGGSSVEEFMIRVPGPNGSFELTVPGFPEADDDLAGYLRRLGLWRLEQGATGGLQRFETSAVARFRELVAKGY
jgi:beta-glucosidase/6-phospho-beta-glucosidase/beta-galactosidase